MREMREIECEMGGGSVGAGWKREEGKEEGKRGKMCSRDVMSERREWEEVWYGGRGMFGDKT